MKQPHMEIDITKHLSKYRGRPFVYVPNPGHLGDALIAYATLNLFDTLGLTYELGRVGKKYSNQDIIYGGGGNFVGLYKACESFLLNNYKDNQILVLPHTVHNVDAALKKLNENVTIVCRELTSYEYVQKTARHPQNILLHRDMAFLATYPQHAPDYTYHLNCFRAGPEKTAITIPNDNIDFTGTCTFPSWSFSKEGIVKAATIMLNFLRPFATVATNRLHVAIAATLMGKEVTLYNNSYYKNKAIYNYSLKTYPNVKFQEAP